MASPANNEAAIAAFEARMLGGDTFTVSGYCTACDRETLFLFDYQDCYTESDGKRRPNWRERGVCQHCHLNTRMREAVGFLLSTSKPDDTIYLAIDADKAHVFDGASGKRLA